MTQWYETLFVNFARTYDQESFTQGTEGELETDEKNHAILRHAAAALRPGGKLILTALHALFPLFHSVKDFLRAAESGTTTGELTFDLMTFRESAELTFTDDAGNASTIKTNERCYTPPEMRWLLHTAGFATIGIFGCHLGQFSRDHALTAEDFEMLVVVEKS